MSLLKHEQWLILGEDESHRIPPDALLGLPPQGKAWIRKEHDEDMSRLTSHIQGALGNTYRGVCHPQRIGHRACLAIHLENLRGKKLDILITVSGKTALPAEESYVNPRWYIDVADSADALYLALWLIR
ncbi:hypothetical protein FNH63_11510 [Salmonella enterica subsp. salamae]|nr:hypothetical protein [Salmonella enterica]ECD9442688.1 hypothetical protein [Salmonella enterica subsp. salamae]EDV1137562.1 hypothetical protein [Salmonella enterica subsp. enterica]EBP4575014.1 hypothetical protein [Salmonella enterica]ECJ5918158.1 hypothetical protein [Salmonella enterica subsp. salamae]